MSGLDLVNSCSLLDKLFLKRVFKRLINKMLKMAQPCKAERTPLESSALQLPHWGEKLSGQNV